MPASGVPSTKYAVFGSSFGGFKGNVPSTLPWAASTVTVIGAASARSGRTISKALRKPIR